MKQEQPHETDKDKRMGQPSKFARPPGSSQKQDILNESPNTFQ